VFLTWYGGEAQKMKYLPKLASGELIAAYALSEASSGSDATNIRTRADPSDGGSHYFLNVEKMWISNAGIAGLFTIFAKVDGKQVSAFLVESSSPGLSIEPEEHEMGIRGSSTYPIILTDCRVPVENLLGKPAKDIKSPSMCSTPAGSSLVLSRWVRRSSSFAVVCATEKSAWRLVNQ